MIEQPNAIRSVPNALPKHLKQLEAESIEIMREVVAEFKKPVMFGMKHLTSK